MKSIFFSGWRHAASLLSLCLAVVLPAMSNAQPAGAEGEHFIYRVQPGDTLMELAERYTGQSRHWTTLQTLNRVEDPTRLSISREVRIPFAIIPEVPSAARIIHVAGEARVNGATARVGGELAEGDTLWTDANGFVTLELSDRSMLSVPPGSVLHAVRLRTFEGTRLSDAVLDMERGGLESEVAPEEKGVGRFEVLTPVSVTGVRGTRLRVRSQAEGAQTEVLSGSARLNTQNADNAMLRAGQGAATDPVGKLLGIRPLLPAPVLAPVIREGGVSRTTFAPVSGAVAYLVQVTEDELGTRLHSTEKSASPDITFRAPGPGTFYVRVRAIDADGVMGKDAVLAFEGRAALSTAFSLAVLTRYAGSVILDH